MVTLLQATTSSMHWRASGLTLVEDPIADSTITYYETLSKLQDGPEENA